MRNWFSSAVAPAAVARARKKPRAPVPCVQHALDAGLYPDATGTHQIFVNAHADPDNPWQAPQPASVVVVGLGEEGKLTEAELTRSVRHTTRFHDARSRPASSANPSAANNLAAVGIPRDAIRQAASR